MIMAGLVELPGRGQARPTAGMRVHEDDQVRLKQRPRYVSRGGDKLANALDAFGLDPDGKTALDSVYRRIYGLSAPAGRVTRIRSRRRPGHNRLLLDDRVVSMERVNARKGFELPERVDLITADVSFISLRLVLPPALDHLRGDGAIIALLKPQFEAGPEKVGKGGVVRDRDTHAETIGQFVDWATAETPRATSQVPRSWATTANSSFCLLRCGLDVERRSFCDVVGLPRPIGRSVYVWIAIAGVGKPGT